VKVAVVGVGYWGPNLIRNFRSHPDVDLTWVCDLDKDLAQKAVGRGSSVRVTSCLDDLLNDSELDAISVATPPGTHCAIAMASLQAGKHVMVEKPLATTVADGRAIVDLAAEKRLVLMCDHTYCYTPVVQKIRDLVVSGTIGDLLFVDSVRINLGLIQKDVDVFWDLAPHDLSILDFVMPERWRPSAVAAHGADPLHSGQACVGYLTLRLGDDALAHIHVNWLSPTKIRTMVIGGSRRTVVWDDLNPVQRISIFDRGVDLAVLDDAEAKREVLVSYRIGEMTAPALPETEALRSVVTEFVSAIRERRRPLTDGRSGLRVLRILDAAERSLSGKGRQIALK
jgi:predicted dehydrogenase